MLFHPRKSGPALALWLAASACYAQNGISVIVDGQPVQFSGTGPTMVDGRVLVPLRGVFEKMGAYVQWDPTRRQVTANRGQNNVLLVIGNPEATVNGQTIRMDVPAEILDGSTMVPIRFVSESIGADVRWQSAQQTVVIRSGADTGNAAPAPEPPAPDEPTPDDPAADPQTADNGPVRMARVAFLQGNVAWRPGDDVDWADAGNNLPVRQGAEFWVPNGARAEIQFDDGSFLRLGSGAVVVLQTMYSDDQGEFTEIRLSSGTASLRLTNQYSRYQVDTPRASIVASGPAAFRVDATNGMRLAVRSGHVRLQGELGTIGVQAGGYVSLNGNDSDYNVVSAPNPDGWDSYWINRDRDFYRPSPHLPASIALVGGGLDSYGDWVNVPQYGYCWRPRVADANWAPYRSGHWVWVSPFGWTWCGSEAWGWAPYHYGTWLPSPSGWVWAPGPAQQYWSPAVVHFSTLNGQVAWCPLAPSEVRYPPAISIGFRSGNWSFHFSIGGAACYTPSGPSYCEPHPWSNRETNRGVNVYNVTNITVTNVYVSNRGFVPRNAGLGASASSTGNFGTSGHFAKPAGNPGQIFTQGQCFAPPSAGNRFSGPTNVRPTPAAFSPTHRLAQSRPNPTVLALPVVRSPIPRAAQSVAPTMPGARQLPRPAPASQPGVMIPNPKVPHRNPITGPGATTPNIPHPRPGTTPLPIRRPGSISGTTRPPVNMAPTPPTTVRPPLPGAVRPPATPPRRKTPRNRAPVDAGTNPPANPVTPPKAGDEAPPVSTPPAKPRPRRGSRRPPVGARVNPPVSPSTPPDPTTASPTASPSPKATKSVPTTRHNQKRKKKPAKKPADDQ